MDFINKEWNRLFEAFIEITRYGKRTIDKLFKIW